jgi:hypothetical protein
MLATHRAVLIGTFVVASQTVAVGSAAAHGGRLNAEGCHHDRKNGGYHCHRGPQTSAPRANDAPAPVSAQRSHLKPSSATYFPNCSAARAAGAAPVRRGEPGYARHLDRDGDGVGCE